MKIMKTDKHAVKKATQAAFHRRELEDAGNRGFYSGFALALADMNRQHRRPTFVEDVMLGAHISLTDLKEGKIASYDLKEIRKALKHRGVLDPRLK
jgi:hypothetical protein